MLPFELIEVDGATVPVKLNSVERLAMNNPVRAAHQHHREARWLQRLAGRSLGGQHVLEIGCGRGVGVDVLLDRLRAARVSAFDLDPLMVHKASRRLRGRGTRVSLSVADVCEIKMATGTVDAVVDFGVIHHVPDWRTALAEVSRVLRPGGLLLFEEVPRHTLDTWAFRTFTVHPRADRFESDEFAEELRTANLSPLAAPENHFAGHLFAGAARRVR